MLAPGNRKSTAIGRRSRLPAILAIGGAIVFLALFVLPTGIGCGRTPLTVNMRLVDARSGKPLRDAVVSVVGSKAFLDDPDFAEMRQDSLDAAESDDSVSPVYFSVSARHADGESALAIESRVLTSGWIVGGIPMPSSRSLPKLLVIDHATYGRTIVPIDQDIELHEFESERRYSIDLGTIRVPR